MQARVNRDASVWPVVLVIYEERYHDEIAELVAVVLKDVRIRVVHACSREQLEAVTRTTPVDLFLVSGCGSSPIDPQTGHVLPVKGGTAAPFDGLGLGLLFRKKFPQIQGIFTSGYQLNESLLATIDRHGMAFLPKPFLLEELLDLVLLLLWRNGQCACSSEHFYSCGRIKQTTGDLRGSLHDLNRAIELNPGDAEALNHRGEVKWGLGDYAGAAADSSSALALLPNFKEALFNRGVAWWAMGEPEKAIGDFDKTIQLDPDQGIAYIYRGTIKCYRHDYAGALTDLNRAENAKFFRATARFYEKRGDVKYALEDFDGAIEDYNRAIRIKKAPRSKEGGEPK